MNATPRPYAPGFGRGHNKHPRLSAAVKSGLSQSLKWALGEGTGLFVLRIPQTPECKDAISYLRSHREPSAQYIDTKGRGRDALQWTLSTWEYRTLYRATPDAP